MSYKDIQSGVNEHIFKVEFEFTLPSLLKLVPKYVHKARNLSSPINKNVNDQ